MTHFVIDLWQEPNTRAAVISVALTALIEFLRRIFTPRARVAYGVSFEHFFIYNSDQGTLNLRVRRLLIQNIGRAVAEDVELILNYRPEHYEVWPPIAEIGPYEG